MRGLNNKTVLVAGAGLIGGATALRLAEEGATVAVGDLNRAAADEAVAQIEAVGGRALALTVDVSREDSVTAFVSAAVEQFGSLHGAYINAADLSPATLQGDTDVVDIDLAAWDRTFDVNLRGSLLVARHVVPQLLRSGGGAVVFTSSLAAVRGGPERPAYAASKAGVIALALHISGKWGAKGVRANAVAPGFVPSRDRPAEEVEQMANVWRPLLRSPRLGLPSDIASTVAFLLSDDAEWITGQTIHVNGGTYV
jgi:NAD(P)-dependent dehydrogenase (short-subunit alcohol dehydrogenase family)